MNKRINSIAIKLTNALESGKMNSACASLTLQISFMEMIKESSQCLQEMSSFWSESAIGDDLKINLNDFSALQSRVLEESLEISNPLLSSRSSQIHAGKLSEAAAVYLGHLTSYVLRTVRYRITPPLALRIDLSKGFHESHHADHREGGISISSLTPITDSLWQRIEDGHNDILPDNLGKMAHVYTGESLLEIVLSDHAYKYSNGQHTINGASVRGEHQTVKEVQSLPIWNFLLPSVVFPSKIDIVIYIVSLQSSYDPLGKYLYYQYVYNDSSENLIHSKR